MKTTIETKAAGTIQINSIYLGNKSWQSNDKNYNNHKITILHNGKKTSFDFWGSIVSPQIETNEDNIFALYCFLSDSISANCNGLWDFCYEFGYDEESKEAKKIYNACQKSLKKAENVFSCNLYDLINELQDTYNC